VLLDFRKALLFEKFAGFANLNSKAKRRRNNEMRNYYYYMANRKYTAVQVPR
jgi:hypothetical protein